MNIRNSINIFLLLFVAGLIAILVFDTEQTTTQTFKLSSISEEQVNSIEITRLTAKPLKFKKYDMQWFMTSPYKVRANAFYIESLMRITKATSTTQFTISNKDKKKFKLSTPQATLKLNDQLFLFGTNEQLHLNRYIFTNEKLYLIPDRFFYLLNTTATGFIDHALIGNDEKIIGLKLQHYNIQLKDNKWQVSPTPKNVATDDIKQLISEWNNSQVIEIKNLNDTNTINQSFSVTVSLKEKSMPIIFDIIKNKDFYFFARRDLNLQFKLNNDMAERLLNFTDTHKNELTSDHDSQK